MPIKRQFFDWHRPALPQVVEWLCRSRQQHSFLDLSDVLFVLPGRRAGRRLEQLLFEQAQGRFAPPDIVTLGQLPERLYDAKQPFANELTQRLAWADALSSFSAAELAPLLRDVPDRGEHQRWLALGEMLSRHHQELAADGLNFADVAARAGDLRGFDEHDRWEVLRQVQTRYLQRLDDLDLWDRETARLYAIEHRECRTDRQILLLAAVDINQAPRRMLDQVADHVTALIHAPEELADHFDEYGCLLPEAWGRLTIDLQPQQVRVVDGPDEQVAEAAYVIAGYDGLYRPDQITVGVADESLAPRLRMQLGECGVPTRPVVERPLPQTPPARLLAAIAEYLNDARTDLFAELARHPDLAAWLHAQGIEPRWLGELDDYIAAHLQPRLGDWLGDPDDSAHLQAAYEAVRGLLAPLIAPPRPLLEWAPLIENLLVEVYGFLEFDEQSLTQRSTLLACRKLQEGLHELTLVPHQLGVAFTAADAIDLALEATASDGVPPPPDPQAIPLLGWLELPLDDAPAAIVTTFNEGFVPGSLNSDLFLPNQVRMRLGVLDNARRYARDAYALSVLLHARESVTLIVGRRTADGDPLKPSRLLFAADRESIARRVHEFYGKPARPVRPPLPSGITTARETPNFVIPRPRSLAVPRLSLSVTDFGRYRACPYRYYLSRVLKLGMVDDVADELTGADFGELVHAVLDDFGRSPLNASTEAREIQGYLDDALDRHARRKLGLARRPAVQLQLEQLRQRLHAFAVRQAEVRDFGWETHHVEVEFFGDNGVTLDLGDGRSVLLTGRIDRIDYHTGDDRWRIIDYKTEAKGLTPDEAHRMKKGEWVDFQLPLYRHLAQSLGVSGNVQLAYFLLPANSERTQLALAEWEPEELEAADELARSIARDILDENFWPPAEGLQYDDWARLCHVGLFDGERLTPEASEDD